MRVAVEPTLRVFISSNRIVQADADVAEAGERLHRLGDQDLRAHEDQRGDGGGYAGGPAATLLVARVAVALENMFAGGLLFNRNNRTFIARL